MPSLCTEPSPLPLQRVAELTPGAMTAKLCAGLLNLLHRAVLLYWLLRHPDTPWFARLLLFFPFLYLCSPIQLLPNFIPVFGQMDDAFVLWAATKLSRKLVDDKTWRDCLEVAATAEFPFLQKLVGGTVQPVNMNSDAHERPEWKSC